MTPRGPWLAFAAACLCCELLASGVAQAHIVYGRPTLHSLVSGAELVARVRVVDPQAEVVLAAGERRPVVVIELREVFKGALAAGGQLRFASHGHGVAEYAAGQEALVFLAPLERSRELAALLAADLRWVSFQEHDARYLLDGDASPLLLDALRGYVAAEAQTEPAARLQALREVTLRLLTSGDADLAAGAIQDLALAGALPLLREQDVPRLLAEVVSAPAAPTGVRVALLAYLEGRGLVPGPPHWLALLRDTSKPGLLQVVRAAGRHPDAAVDARLVELLRGEDDELAEVAALALGHPAHASATGALAEALAHRSARVRMAAIRALEGIGSAAARSALARAAREHADPATRRRAAAAVRSATR